ncbi:hypothetical protein RchiOBHm_Chr7g0181671 [Rosa chinensis]|uniref:Uncharacterized protein n=1 Tax=Rosa chinensis TaxID=74649 RepID=A0A2P6P2Q0_ROSCH|nr:hypothetical protein RchiOBHm_Chr7g0181671 [Rosa chinensis]
MYDRSRAFLFMNKNVASSFNLGVLSFMKNLGLWTDLKLFEQVMNKSPESSSLHSTISDFQYLRMFWHMSLERSIPQCTVHDNVLALGAVPLWVT